MSRRPNSLFRLRGGTVRHLAILALLLFAYALVVLLGPHSTSDEGDYVTYAENLTHGWYSGRGADIDLWFGPGLPLLLAPLAVVDAPIELMRLLGALLLTVAVLLFYVVLRLTVAPSAALLGALGLGLYWPLLPLLPTLHSEIPALLAVATFMLVMTLDLGQPRMLTLFGASACLAFLAVTRVVFGWVLLVVLVVGVVGFVVFRSLQINAPPSGDHHTSKCPVENRTASPAAPRRMGRGRSC